jgi:arabinan endo-1,5-alpha-L-arabinosidase
VGALCACSSGASGGPGDSSQGGGESAGAGTFVIDQDFPDPDVMKVDDTYYAYATNTPAANVHFATSKDLTSWTVASTDALPELPTWALPGKTWAPDVSAFSAGHYVMYFVAASADPAYQCIGVATATAPEGPFTPAGDRPLLCPADEGGAIDPSTFVDTDGIRYLVWKNDGNCCGLDTWLQVAPLAGDGLSLAGPTTKLIKQTDAWEGSLIEAPVIVKHGSNYVLFYSANNYGGGDYAIGYATAQTVTGPYTKHGKPLLSTTSSDGRYFGPGGEDVVTAPDGTDRLVFHSWDPAVVYRGMNIVQLEWKNDEPVVVLK